MLRKKLLTIFLGLAVLGAGAYGAHQYLKNRIEQAIYQSLKQYDVAFDALEIKPFSRSVEISNLEISGLLEKPQNRLGIGHVTVSDIDVSGGEVSGLKLNAQGLDLFIDGWVSQGPNQSVVYNAASLEYRKKSDDIFLKNIDVKNSDGSSAFRFSEVNLTEVKKKDGSVTYLNFVLKGFFEASQKASIKQYALQSGDVKKRSPEALEENRYRYVLNGVYEKDVMQNETRLRQVRFNLPKMDLKAKIDQVKWSSQKDGVFPIAAMQSVEGFAFELPMERLEKAMSDDIKAHNDYEVLRNLEIHKLAADYKMTYRFEPTEKTADLVVDLNVKDKLALEFVLGLSNLDPSYITSVDEVFFMKTIELKALRFTYRDLGLMKNILKLRAEQEGKTEEEMQKEFMSIYDQTVGVSKSVFEIEAREALQNFLKGKNEVSVSLDPVFPVKLGDIAQSALVSVQALTTSLRAKITGK